MKKRILQIVVFLAILFVLDRGVAAFFRTGLERYYGIGHEADILVIGHSHLMKTCNKKTLERELDVKIAKYCCEGVLTQARLAMVKHFLEKQKGRPVSYMLYGVDPLLFHSGGLGLNSYKQFYPYMDTAAMDAHVRRNASWWDYTLHKHLHCARYIDVSMYRSARGWMGYWESLSRGQISTENWNKPRPWSPAMDEENVKAFHEAVQLMLDNGAHVVLVYPSTIQSYRTSNPEAYEYMMNYFRTMADNHPRIDFLDYSPLYAHRQELFEDPVHLNRMGEKLLTQQLIRDLKGIMQQKK